MTSTSSDDQPVTVTPALATPPVRQRQTNWAALAVMAILLIGVGLVFRANRRPSRPQPRPPSATDWAELRGRALELRDRSQLDQALQAATAAVELAPVVHEQGHFALPESLNLVGLILTDQGDYPAAIAAFQEAIPRFQQIFGPESTQVAQASANMALALMKLGRYETAQPIFESTLEFMKSLTGPTSSQTIQATTNLAVLFDLAGQPDKSRPLHEQVLDLRRKSTGPAALETAAAMANLAACLLRQAEASEEAAAGQDLRRAAELYEIAALIRSRLLPADSLSIANALAGLAKVRLAEGKLDEAERLAIESLAVRQSKLGPGHPTVATSYDGLAQIQAAHGKTEEATDYFERALAIRVARLGPTHPLTRQSLESLGAFHRAGKRWEQAMRPAETLVTFIEETDGEDAITLAEPLETLALVVRNVANAQATREQTVNSKEVVEAVTPAAKPPEQPAANKEPATADGTPAATELSDSKTAATDAPQLTAAELLVRADELEKRAEAIRVKDAERIAAEAKAAAAAETAPNADTAVEPAEEPATAAEPTTPPAEKAADKFAE